MYELAKICIEVSGKDLGIKKLEVTEGSPKEEHQVWKNHKI